MRFAVDLRSLALFRMGLGVVVAGDAVDRARCVLLLTDDGPSPRALVASLGGTPSLHGISGDADVVLLLLALQVLVGLALLVGAASRVAAVVSFLLVVSVQLRAPLGPFAGDLLLRALLFWSLFLPLGARLSVDSRADRSAGHHLSPASAALLLQPIVLYISSAIWKLMDPDWRAGDVLAVVLRMRLHTSELAGWAQQLPEGLLRGAGWATLVVEGLLPLLLLTRRPRLRLAALVVLLLFQASMDALLTVGFFAWLSNIALLPALPSRVFRSDAAAGPTTTSSRPVTVIVAVCAAAWLAWTAAAFVVERPPLSRPLSLLGLAQKWEMFGHPGQLPRGWFLVPGTRADGAVVDVVTGAVVLDGSPPPVAFSELFLFRERMTLIALLYEPYAPYAPHVGAWLCRRYNEGRPAAERITSIEGFFVDEAYAPPRPFSVFAGPCP